MKLEKYLRPLYAPDGAAGAGDAGAAGGSAGAAGGAAAVWHTGVEPETLGFWQNKGYDVTNPLKLASELTKQYQEAQRFMGAPPDQILRIPKADAKPEDIKAFWGKLGTPADAKDYDFSGIKTAAGEPLAPALADALRAASANAFLPKDAATKIAASVAKHLDDTKAADTAVTTAKAAEEKGKLATNWGTKFDFNHLQAMEGARRLGITPEAVKALEGQIGYSGVMEAMRKIGAATSEDTFVERGAGGAGGPPTTQAGAMSRKAELMSDPAWCKRYTGGDVAARLEMTNLNTMIDGEARAA